MCCRHPRSWGAQVSALAAWCSQHRSWGARVSALAARCSQPQELGGLGVRSGCPVLVAQRQAECQGQAPERQVNPGLSGGLPAAAGECRVETPVLQKAEGIKYRGGHHEVRASSWRLQYWMHPSSSGTLKTPNECAGVLFLL